MPNKPQRSPIKLRIGTRSSPLAMAQTQIAIDKLCQTNLVQQEDIKNS